MAEEYRHRSQTCPKCQSVLDDRARRGTIHLIPMRYMVREGTNVHIMGSDNHYLCGRDPNSRRKKGNRMNYTPLNIILWCVAIFFIIWLLSAIF